jgi:single-strand binding protein
VAQHCDLGQAGLGGRKYLKKGQEIVVEGKLVHRVYESNGEKRYITEINVNDLLMLGGKQQ